MCHVKSAIYPPPNKPYIKTKTCEPPQKVRIVQLEEKDDDSVETAGIFSDDEEDDDSDNSSSISDEEL